MEEPYGQSALSYDYKKSWERESINIIFFDFNKSLPWLWVFLTQNLNFHFLTWLISNACKVKTTVNLEL